MPVRGPDEWRTQPPTVVRVDSTSRFVLCTREQVDSHFFNLVVVSVLAVAVVVEAVLAVAFVAAPVS